MRDDPSAAIKFPIIVKIPINCFRNEACPVICVSLFVNLLFISSYAHAILIDKAFTSTESINYLYQTPVYDLQVLDSNILVARNDAKQLIGLDVLNQNLIQWKLDLDVTKDYQLLVTNDKILGFKLNEPEIIEIDANGAINFIDIKRSIAHLYECKYGGVFVLTTDNALIYIDQNSNKHQVHSNVSNFVVDCHDGYIYLIIDSAQLIKLSTKGEIVFEKEVSLGSIREFKSGIALTQNDQIFKLDHRSKSFKRVDNDEFGNLVVIGSSYLYSRSPKAVKLINIDKKAKQVFEIKATSLVKLYSTTLQHLLIISDGTTRQVYDLTDFLYTHDTHSIKKFQFKLGKDYPYELIATTPDFQLGYVALDGNLYGELFSLFDGSKVKDIKPTKPQYSSDKGIYIIIDPPESDKIKSEVYNLAKESNSKLVFTNWLHRVIRHLNELGRFIVDYNHWFDFEDLSMDAFNKLIVFYDAKDHKVVAVNSYDGEVAWESNPLGVESEFITLKQIDTQDNQEVILVVFATEIYKLYSHNGAIASVISNDEGYTNIVPVDTFYALESNHKFLIPHANPSGEKLHFAKTIDDSEIDGHVILPGSLDSIQTWSYNFNEPIVAQARINNQDSKVSTIGIPKSDKSVLYKYLNRNLIAVLTLEDQLKFYLLDGVSGELLHQQSHNKSEIIDPNSINLIIDDNWIVYTYFTKQPRLEQRINVIDLFKTSNKDNKDTNSNAGLKIGQVFTESFVYPERILDLSSTQSKHGITLKSIIAYTESGNLVELPKFILNSRRPQHQMKPTEFQDDFRLTPYDPIVPKNNYQTINHKYQLFGKTNKKKESASSILIKPTDFESTVVVCFLNNEVRYCSLVQPSLSFDLLNKNFEKLKLVITIVILFVLFIVTKPYVANKKLKSQWLDYKK
ncbi:hypothetical protein CANMA_002698 [Candida margitis]|uniref:uncharacterized protein n=1 Tax=Candida margitis TaxID=1775924 RepID=UPI002227A978|nr:uncharacterized protein CANMA_002698 [Candida margitis]KAI5967930.1 hypothetical protein CANMA_002698 [Candida margitis]